MAYKGQQIGGRRMLTFQNEDETAVKPKVFLHHLKKDDKGCTRGMFDILSPSMDAQVRQPRIAKAACRHKSGCGLYMNRLLAYRDVFYYLANSPRLPHPARRTVKRFRGSRFWYWRQQ